MRRRCFRRRCTTNGFTPPSTSASSSSALLFWWALIHGHRGVTNYGVAVLYLFTTAIHSGLLGALLTFARTPWYPDYDDTPVLGSVAAGRPAARRADHVGAGLHRLHRRRPGDLRRLAQRLATVRRWPGPAPNMRAGGREPHNSARSAGLPMQSSPR